MSHYVTSKGGVVGLTRSLAREMGQHNVYLNCITPGAIKTEAEAKVVTAEQAQAFMDAQSLRRRLMPLDVARVCLFLVLRIERRHDRSNAKCGRRLGHALADAL